MTRKRRRFTREQWLTTSLDLLASEGIEKLTIDHLVRSMGVTKGSFYWHFKNRSDFILSLVEHWAVEFTENIGREVSALEGSAEDRLLALMQLLSENDVARYNLAMMRWGIKEPLSHKRIQDVFSFQKRFVRNLFKEMGFTGDELEMRTNTMVFFQTAECSLYFQVPKSERLRHVALRHKMLISPGSP